MIGTLTAVISAQTSGFEQGMKRSQAAMGGLSSGSKSLGADLLKMAIPAVTVGGALVAVSKSLERMDNLVDVADSIGITTDSLISLRFAAEQGASSAEGMDSALGTMVKNVGLTGMGVGRAAASIKELGLNVDDLQGMAPDKMFATFAEAISKVEDKTEQAAIASRIFGDEGQKLLSVLRGGSAGLAMTDAQAEALGLHLGEGARRAAEAHDALQRAGGAAQAMGDAIAIELAPSIIKLVDLLERNRSKVAEFAGFLGYVAEQAAEGALALADLAGGLIDPASMMPEFATNTKAAADGLRAMKEEAAAAKSELAEAAREEQKILDIVGDLESKRNAQLGGNKTLDDLDRLGALPEVKDHAAQLQKEIDAHDALADKMAEQQAAQDALARSAEDLVDKMRTPYEVLQDEMEKVLELFNQGMIDFVTFSRATANLQEQFEKDNAPRGGGNRSVGFMAEGSAAAFSTANQYRNSGMEDLARQALRKQAEEIKAVVGVREAIEKGFQQIETFEF